ncbi:MAG: glycosyltransferase family 39 protein [Xanthobacteraceae bacterium]
MLRRLAVWWCRLLDRVIGALSDPIRGNRTFFTLLAGYVAVWSLYGAIAKSSQDVHFDMGEAVVWSHEALAGTPKHPPLSGWLVWLWFSVFPQADWAYYLFAMVLAAIGLWAAWKLSAHYLPAEKRIAGLALLTLVPFYNFHALKFNANSVMLPLWALATWAFVRSFETRKALPAALAGLAAAASMFGKYWSVMLLAGLAIAALTDPRRWVYLRSPAPWITIAVGVIALIPHLLWLHEHASTFSYALESHPGTVWTSLRSGLNYVRGACAYAVVPIVVAFVAARPSRAALADTVWPSEPDRRLAVIALIAPILLPIVAALATESLAVSLWSIGGLTLLPVVLLSSPLVLLSHNAVRRIVGLTIIVPFAALFAAPFAAFAIHRQGLDNYSGHYRLVARAVERAWQDTTNAPLQIFGSYDNLLYGSSFYFSKPPRTFEIVSPNATPWTPQADVESSGIAMACPEELVICMQALESRVASAGPRARRSTVDLTSTFLGMKGQTQRFVIAVVPPS